MLFPLWLPLAAALAGSPVPSPPLTTLSGHLIHAPAGDTVRVWLGPHAYKAALRPGGDFTLRIKDLAAPTTGSLSYARQRTGLYVSPGDDLTLTLDFADFDKTLVYRGRGAAANNYLAQSLYRFAFGPAGAVPRPEEQRTPSTTAAQARQQADAFRRAQQKFLATYAQAHPLPAAFRQQAAQDIDLQWGRLLLDYPGYIAFETKKPAALPATYFDFLKELPIKKLNKELGRETVLRFLSAYGSRLDAASHLTTDPASAQGLYRQATADLGPGPARDLAVYQVLSYSLAMGDAGAAIAAYPTFRAQNQDSALARSLRPMVAQQARLLPGQPAPGFTLRDASGQLVALSSFKGQVVYLDFWASWCVPCLNETPAAVTLKKQFEGRDVVFLYLSVDRDPAAWQQALATHPLASANSVHLRDQAGDTSAQATYQANGIPSYWLIGRDGRIVLAHAPRPSDGAKTVAAIEAALQQ